MDNLEEMIKELSLKHTYTIYKRSLPLAQPSTLNKVIVQNLPSYEAGVQFCKTMKLETKELYEEGGARKVVFYDILPDTEEYKNVFYNDSRMTTVGNNKKRVALNYMDLED